MSGNAIMVQNRETQMRLSVDQCRSVDRYAIKELGIPGGVLMENAGRNTADLIERWIAEWKGEASKGRVVVVGGRGNNGGDGWVIARHLIMRGHEVRAHLVGDPEKLSGDAAVNHAILKRMGVAIEVLSDEASVKSAASRWGRADVIVDALLGTGFAGEVREPMASAIEAINGVEGAVVVAVDVPSGLNADAGTSAGATVRADHTVTFLAEKSGYAEASAAEYLGQVHVVDIGAPLELILSRLDEA